MYKLAFIELTERSTQTLLRSYKAILMLPHFYFWYISSYLLQYMYHASLDCEHNLLNLTMYPLIYRILMICIAIDTYVFIITKYQGSIEKIQIPRKVSIYLHPSFQ